MLQPTSTSSSGRSLLHHSVAVRPPCAAARARFFSLHRLFPTILGATAPLVSSSSSRRLDLASFDPFPATRGFHAPSCLVVSGLIFLASPSF
ncbi:hypothetical protein CJ030_MR1G027581 [Morella rubra]|uniref:Uncharacterized protein n=1 Tax=Morella rubra TaxID=262757 RepID=A0A6A1WI96_9ROSI|nr:hypothetical protein CJ030_MR1G027581 [Morella rubra]